MSLSVGIVGLPNVGKSTLFNALVKANQAQVSNYPFCTIEPNVGIVEVPDKRLNRIADLIVNPKSEIRNPKQILNSKSEIPNIKKIPAPLKFIDIAGLVKGAHKGEGLGNKFLSHIQECDAIAMVIRAFADKKITHTEGEPNPERDAKIIHTELILKDLEMVDKNIQNLKVEVKSGDKLAIERLEVLKNIKNNLDQEKTVREAGLSIEQKELIKSIQFLTAKPIMYIINISEDQIADFTDKSSRSLSSNNIYSSSDSEKTELNNNFNGPVIYICAKTEADLITFPQKEAADYLKSIGQERSVLEQIIIEGYKLLDLITFYTIKMSSEEKVASSKKTISNKRRAISQVQAWPIPAQTLAPKAAGLIHSDFEKGFIKAEVVKYVDLISAGSLLAVRESGAVNIVGKDYLIQDGDIVQFKFNN